MLTKFWQWSGPCYCGGWYTTSVAVEKACLPCLQSGIFWLSCETWWHWNEYQIWDWSDIYCVINEIRFMKMQHLPIHHLILHTPPVLYCTYMYMYHINYFVFKGITFNKPQVCFPWFCHFMITLHILNACSTLFYALSGNKWNEIYLSTVIFLTYMYNIPPLSYLIYHIPQ